MHAQQRFSENKPVKEASFTMTVPVRRTASHGMVMPVGGITSMSPGTRLSLGTSMGSAEMCMFVCVCMRECCMFLCLCMCIRVCVCTCVCMYVCVYVCVCVCTCVCIVCSDMYVLRIVK